MKNIRRHERITIFLMIFAALLLWISIWPCGWEEWTGILQGTATGLISGIILLVVTNVKGKDYRRLTKVYKEMHEINLNMSKITNSYSEYYHKTYHGKADRMEFSELHELVKKILDDYHQAYMKLNKIDIEQIEDSSIKTQLRKYIKKLYEEEIEIHNLIENCENKETLINLCDNFYELQYQARAIYILCLKKETDADESRMALDKSLV